MGTLVWRKRAKFVAVIDMVQIFPSTLWLTLLLWYDRYARYELFEPYYSGASHVEKSPYMVGLLFTLVASFYVMVGLAFWAVIKLIMATNPKEDPKQSLRMASFWWNATVALFCMFAAGQLRELNIVGLVMTIVWRSGSLYVVYQFMDELESYLQSAPPCGDITTPECDENISSPNYLSIRSFFVELSSL